MWESLYSGAQAEGRSNQDIMKALHMSERDIINHQQQIMQIHREIERVKSACRQESENMQIAISTKNRAEVTKRRCIKQTSVLRGHVKNMKARALLQNSTD